MIVIVAVIAVVAVAGVTLVAAGGDEEDSTSTVTFVADGKVVKEVDYDDGDSALPSSKVPTVPAKPGYTSHWNTYSLNGKDITVNAVYSPITYYATFVFEGAKVAQVPFTMDNTEIKAPDVEGKTGYHAEWGKYSVEPRSFTVNGAYQLTQYKATFIDGKATAATSDDSVVAIRTFTIETKSISNPTVPSKTGYYVAWPSYTLGTSDITVKAQYSLITYSVTFHDGKATVSTSDDTVVTRNFNVENLSVTNPPVPSKIGYTVKWADYTLSAGNKTVNAVYTPIDYKITFVDTKNTSTTSDDTVSGTRTYNITTSSVSEPPVPQKTWYKVDWADYSTMGHTGDMTVKSVYTHYYINSDVKIHNYFKSAISVKVDDGSQVKSVTVAGSSDATVRFVYAPESSYLSKTYTVSSTTTGVSQTYSMTQMMSNTGSATYSIGTFEFVPNEAYLEIKVNVNNVAYDADVTVKIDGTTIGSHHIDKHGSYTFLYTYTMTSSSKSVLIDVDEDTENPLGGDSHPTKTVTIEKGKTYQYVFDV